MVKLKSVFWTTLGIAILAYLISKLQYKDIKPLITNFNIYYLIPYLIVSLLIFTGFVIRWKIILNIYQKGINLIDLFLYKFAGYFISYITPSAKVGGEGIRVYFLMKEKGLTFDKATSSVIIDKIIEINTNGLFVIVGILWFILNFSLPTEIVWVLIVILFSIIGIITFYYYRIFNNKYFFFPIIRFLRLNKIKSIKKNEIKIIESEKKMINFHLEHKKEFILTILISLILLVLSVVEFKMLTLMFGYNISIVSIFSILTFIAIAYSLPIPGALGVLEGGQITLSEFMRIGKGPGISVAILTRIRDTVWAFIGFVYLYVKRIKYGDFIKGHDDFLINPRVKYFKEWKIK